MPAKRKPDPYSRGALRAPLDAVPITIFEAQTEVLDAAFTVEHAYSVGGGWSVPLSLTLHRLATAVRALRLLDRER